MQRPEFVSVDDTYTCAYCKLVLIGALQTECGHRICTPCLEDLFKNTDCVPCPAKEDECIFLKRDEMCKDFSAQRAILNLEVYCPNKRYGCQRIMSWKEYLNDHFNSCDFQPIECANENCTFVGDLQQMAAHATECPFQEMICSNCNKAIFSREESFTEHLNKCMTEETACLYSSFGCDFKGTNDILKKHSNESFPHHVSLLAIHLRKLQIGLRSMEKDIKDNHRENVRLEALFQEKFSEMQSKVTILDKYAVTELENKKKFVNLSEMFIANNIEFQQFKETMLRGGLNSGANQNTNTLIQQILDQTSVHDREIGVHDVKLAKIDTRITSLETPCYDGKFIWKVSNYSKIRANAKNTRRVSIYSQPFYSSRFGYKMCGRIYPNGDGDGKGTHMSFFFMLMKGEYDNILPWPFHFRVTLTLLDQVTGKKNVSDNFIADPGSISFCKPTSEMNIATGCPCFVSQQQVEESPFMIDDIIFLEITIGK